MEESPKKVDVKRHQAAVSVTAVAGRRGVTHVIAWSTCDGATRANRVARVRHGRGVMAHHFVRATCKRTLSRRAPVVAITGGATRRRVAHILTWSTGDGAAGA